MIGADELAHMQGNVGCLVVEEPAQAHEGRGIADDLLGLGDGSIPVWLLAGGRSRGEFRVTVARSSVAAGIDQAVSVAQQGGEGTGSPDHRRHGFIHGHSSLCCVAL